MLISTLVDGVNIVDTSMSLTVYVNFYSRRYAMADENNLSLTVYVNFYSRRYRTAAIPTAV